MGKLRQFAEMWGYLEHDDIQKHLLPFEDPESVLKQQLDFLTDFESIRQCVSDNNISDNDEVREKRANCCNVRHYFPRPPPHII